MKEHRYSYPRFFSVRPGPRSLAIILQTLPRIVNMALLSVYEGSKIHAIVNTNLVGRVPVLERELGAWSLGTASLQGYSAKDKKKRGTQRTRLHTRNSVCRCFFCGPRSQALSLERRPRIEQGALRRR